MNRLKNWAQYLRNTVRNNRKGFCLITNTKQKFNRLGYQGGTFELGCKQTQII